MNETRPHRLDRIVGISTEIAPNPELLCSEMDKLKWSHEISRMQTVETNLKLHRKSTETALPFEGREEESTSNQPTNTNQINSTREWMKTSGDAKLLRNCSETAISFRRLFYSFQKNWGADL